MLCANLCGKNQWNATFEVTSKFAMFVLNRSAQHQIAPGLFKNNQ